MLRLTLFTCICFLLGTTLTKGQERQILLKSGPVPTSSFIPLHQLSADHLPEFPEKDPRYMILHFSRIPNAERQATMASAGIQLLSYLPQNAFLTSLPAGFDLGHLSTFEVENVIRIQPEFKLSSPLSKDFYPEYCLVDNNKVRLHVLGYPGTNPALLASSLREANIEVLESVEDRSPDNHQRHIEIILPKEDVLSLAALPFVHFIDLPLAETTPTGFKGRAGDRVNMMNAPGSGLDGSGVNISIGDKVSSDFYHEDIKGRFELHPPVTNSNPSHGHMTSGMAIGAGNIDPRYIGHAPGAYVHLWDDSWTQVTSAIAHYQNYNTVVTSTSWKRNPGGMYNNASQDTDRDVVLANQITHVVSAGNEGDVYTPSTNFCRFASIPRTGWGYFGNTSDGVNAAKNVITVGNYHADGFLQGSSSCGPTQDARLKPDVVATGHGQMTTDTDNEYQAATGTSASTPGVAGLAALLYQGYRQDHNGLEPNSALIKNLILNTADDFGRPGPDYVFGYGKVNGFKAAQTLTAGRFFSDVVGGEGQNQHNLQVPPNVKQVRVMITWVDPEPSSLAGNALVNNLDLELTTPMGLTLQPWILGSGLSTASLEADAIRGVDTRNNVEQITFVDPPFGNYTITVHGSWLPTGSQEYFITYHFDYDNIMVTHPFGGESFVQDEEIPIQWDAFGNYGNFLLDISHDGGNTWTNFETVPGDQRQFNWTVQNIVSGESMIRVRRGAKEGISGQFNIIGTPLNVEVYSMRGVDKAAVSWTSIPGPLVYGVYKVGAEYMEYLGSTSGPSYEVSGLVPGEEYWFAVTVTNTLANATSRRSKAVKYVHENNTCSSCDQSAHSTFPYVESFESNAPNLWCQGVDDDINWARTTNGTPGNGTGPAAASDGMNMMFLYGADPRPEKWESRANFESNCFLFPSGSEITMEFDYHMWGTTMGKFYFQVSDNDGAYWKTHLFREGDQGDTWHTAELDLSEYAGKRVIFRFHAITGQGTSSDMAIDNIRITTEEVPCGDCSGIAWGTYPTEEGFEDDFGLWCNSTNDDIDWSRNTGQTPTQNTGPTSASFGDFYIYTESSGPNNPNKQATLESRCLDFPANSTITINFDFNMIGSDIDHLRLDAAPGTSNSWATYWTAFGDQGSFWLSSVVNLSNLSGGRARLQFTAVNSSGELSDIALDNIRITVAPNREAVEELPEQLQSAEDSRLKLYPVPASEHLMVQFQSSEQIPTFKILNIMGQEMPAARTQVLDEERFKLDISHLRSGTYLLWVQSEQDIKPVRFNVVK